MKTRKIFILFITVFFCMIVASMSWAGNNDAKFVPGELMIKMTPGVSNDKTGEICASHGAYVVREMPQIGWKLIRVPEHALETVMAALNNNPNVEFAEPNFIAEGAVTPNDPSYENQWHLPKISAPTGWNTSTGSSEIVIAVIDSGVDSDHPDLVNKLVPGYNFLFDYDPTNTNDVLGHGTAVAGSAAAETNNGIGVAGVAWENSIMPLVVLDKYNSATYADIIDAINYAADNNADVINISIGGSGASNAERDAINYAWNKGVVIVACAMNNSNDTLQYPAAYENVISVSATNSSDTIAYFSSYGDWITISAPGEGIFTTNKGGVYGYHNGTSFASPITAGLAALVLSVNPDLTNVQVVALIEQNADDLGVPGHDIYYGNGRINVNNTLIAAAGELPDPDITPPSVSITSPAEGTIVSGTITVTTEATDNVAVERVDLRVGGSVLCTKTTEPYNFTLDTTDLAEEYNELIAEAYDTSGNIGYSDDIMINVDNIPEGDVTPPTVTIMSPENEAIITKLAKVNASASDDTGIVEMRLYIDGDLKVTKTRSVLRYTLNARKFSAGLRTLLVEADDAAGNVGSSSITIFINK